MMKEIKSKESKIIESEKSLLSQKIFLKLMSIKKKWIRLKLKLMNSIITGKRN